MRAIFWCWVGIAPQRLESGFSRKGARRRKEKRGWFALPESEKLRECSWQAKAPAPPYGRAWTTSRLGLCALFSWMARLRSHGSGLDPEVLVPTQVERHYVAASPANHPVHVMYEGSVRLAHLRPHGIVPREERGR